MSDCPRIRVLLGGYVLQGLTTAETAVVDAHLRGCAACRREVAELADLPQLLSLVTTDQPSPPGPLRDRVLQSAPAGRRRYGGRRRLATLIAAALAGAVVGGAGTMLLERAPRSDDALVVRLEPAPGDDGGQAGGTARLTQTASGIAVELDLRNLPPLPDRGLYEAWLGSEEGAIVSAGTFRPDPRGRAQLALTAGGSLDGYTRMGVTAEPDDTDPARNGEPVTLAALP